MAAQRAGGDDSRSRKIGEADIKAALGLFKNQKTVDFSALLGDEETEDQFGAVAAQIIADAEATAGRDLTPDEAILLVEKTFEQAGGADVSAGTGGFFGLFQDPGATVEPGVSENLLQRIFGG
jgi:hypothetical protein